MALRSLTLAVLCFASLLVQGAGVPGVTKPLDTGAPKRIEQLQLGAGPEATLALPPLDAAAKSAIADLPMHQVGISRRSEVEAQPSIDASSLTWVAAAGGYASRIRVVSPGAVQLRVGLVFTAMPADLQIRAASAAGGEVTRIGAADLFKLTGGTWPIEHWTNTSDGEVQVIELWTSSKPVPQQLAFRITDVSHGFSKALDFTCHVDIACVADTNVRNDGKGVARMRFVKDGSAFVCTGSLLNDSVSSMTPLFVTANHCISTSAVAATLETWFFYYPATCNGTPAAPTKLTGGATLLVADFDTDFSLMRLMSAAPAGAHFFGWDTSALPIGTAVFGIHHPGGESQRYMAGSMTASVRVTDSDTGLTFRQNFNRITMSQGIIEGGSSGSPLLTGTGTFRGQLFGSPSTNACGNTSNTASYSDFSKAYPLASTFLAGPNAADDHADSPGSATVLKSDARIVAQINRDGDADWFRFTFATFGNWSIRSFSPSNGTPLDVVGEVYAADGVTRLAVNDDRSPSDRNFEMVVPVTAGTYLLKVTGHAGATGAYGVQSSFELPDDHGNTFSTATPLAPQGTAQGSLQSATDQDWFRITFDGPGLFTVRSTGTTDMYGRLYRSDGTTLIMENDDIVLATETNFQVSAAVNGPDTFYLQVTGFNGDVGSYGLTSTFTPGVVNPNYTDLWWNASESGWGMNLNHQGDTIFATIFTYASDRQNLWLVGTALAKQPNGSYAGALYRSTGPAFNAQPWGAYQLTQVGTISLTFAGPDSGTLVYTVNGVTVSKVVTRQRYSTAPTCTFVAATTSRTSATNFQDLWWNPAEAGWGLNITHQGSIIFATLFTYGADGRDAWFVGDNLRRQADGTFTGALRRATGPAFNTVPWTPITLEDVGTMTFNFVSGINGTVRYTVGGVEVVKQIERQVFGERPTLCQ